MTSLRLFDTHAHLDHEHFPGMLPDVLDRARLAGVVGICAVGCTPESSQHALRLAQADPRFIVAAAGIQPNYVSQAEPQWMPLIEQLASSPAVVAIGETGLDCYWKDSPLALQREYFEQHIELSLRCDKPLIIHMRDSGPEILETLRKYAPVADLRGIMHSFTGDWGFASQFLDLGLHLSFAGMLTFTKNSAELQRVAARVPEDRLLIETDSPYLSPEPLRGKRPNEPARIVHTAAKLAEIRGVPPEKLAETTAANAMKLFRWSAGL